jgi:hypothetical protein
MKTAKIDTSPWNLGLPLALLAACGPAIPVDEGETATEGETENNTVPTSVGTVDPDECRTDEDCGGYPDLCIDGQCIEGYDYCDTDGCCEDGCCYDGCWYPDCYEDLDCGSGYVCEYNYCQPIPLPEPCDGGRSIADGIPLFEGEGNITSLAFIEGNASAGRELLVGNQGGVTLVASDGTMVVVTASPSSDLAAADLDGDGDEDVVSIDTASPPMLRTILADGAGAFVEGTSSESNGLRLALGDADGNGTVDAIIGGELGIVLRAGIGDGSFAPAIDLLAVPNAAFIVMPPTVPPYADLLFHDGAQLWVGSGADGFSAVPLYPGTTLASGLALVRGDHDGDGVSEASVIDATSFAPVIRTWRVVAGALPSDWSPPGSPTLLATGDLDADGRDELALAAADGTVWVRFGEPVAVDGDGLGCYVSGMLGGGGAQRLVLDDFDGDGRADVVSAAGAALWWVPST